MLLCLLAWLNKSSFQEVNCYVLEVADSLKDKYLFAA